jgi:hypothetical protein
MSVASSANPGGRSSGADMLRFEAAIFQVTDQFKPCSARHVYYQAVTRGLVAKDTGKSRANEARVGRALNVMRENMIDRSARWAVAELTGAARRVAAVAPHGTPTLSLPPMTSSQARSMLCMPMTWIVDNTRTRYQADRYDGKEEAFKTWHRIYRRNLWQRQERLVEVWCESDSIAGVLHGTLWDYGLALLPCRGQSGKRFVWDSAQAYGSAGKPVTVLYVGDFDPAGLGIASSVEKRISRYLPHDSDVEIEFRPLAIIPEQVLDLGLTGHGLNAKTAKGQMAKFLSVCDEHGIDHEAVEAEAMDPNTLRDIVSDAVEEYVDEDQWQLELAIEEEERADIFTRLGLQEKEPDE